MKSIRKLLLQITFMFLELINWKSNYYLNDNLVVVRRVIALKSENKTRGSATKLEVFINGIHARDKRIRTFNHFKQLKTNGKRRNAQWNRV